MDSRFGFFTVPPNADTWAVGDRRMICYLHGGVELTSTAAGVNA